MMDIKVPGHPLNAILPITIPFLVFYPWFQILSPFEGALMIFTCATFYAFVKSVFTGNYSIVDEM